LSVAFPFGNPQIIHQADPTTGARDMVFPFLTFCLHVYFQ